MSAVHDRERDHVDGRSLRPKTARLENSESALQMRAALSGRLDAVPRHGVLGLQHTVGNAAVATLLKPVQCSACGPGCGCGPCADEATEPGLPVQRHQGVDNFREKSRLESAELGSVPELQVAVSSAVQALEVGRHSGAGVARLQEVLRSKGYTAPSSGVYDRATQSAVAKFQADHGIPFPTGRQAGPKTLSTLDDHSLGKKPTPKPECNQYAPGEHARSRSSPGTSRRLGTFGKELELLNYGANQDRLKPEHQAALKKFVDDFALFDPCTDFKVDKIIGFTDSVDREKLNEQLRLDRANTVAGILQANGVPSAPDGLSADPAPTTRAATPSPGLRPGASPSGWSSSRRARPTSAGTSLSRRFRRRAARRARQARRGRCSRRSPVRSSRAWLRPR